LSYFVAEKNGAISDSKAFLFSLNNPTGADPFKLTLANPSATAAATTSTSMPTFGQDDIVLKDNANTSSKSYTTPGTSYQLLSSVLNSSQDFFTDNKYFIADEIEVFYNQGNHVCVCWAENGIG
jgi:hypothetical protein